jgi:hypothetical protein
LPNLTGGVQTGNARGQRLLDGREREGGAGPAWQISTHASQMPPPVRSCLAMRVQGLSYREGCWTTTQANGGLTRAAGSSFSCPTPPQLTAARRPAARPQVCERARASRVHLLLRCRLFTPEVQWRSRGKRHVLQGCQRETLGTETLVVPVLQTLIRFKGTKTDPVKDVSITGVNFRDAGNHTEDPLCRPI